MDLKKCVTVPLLLYCAFNGRDECFSVLSESYLSITREDGIKGRGMENGVTLC